MGRPARYPAGEAMALVKSSERGVAEVARSLGIALNSCVEILVGRHFLEPIWLREALEGCGSPARRRQRDCWRVGGDE